ncbi:MAG: TolC family protein, partial [Rhodospirillaceae bacterium]
EIAKNAYDTGATSFLTLLDAQRTYQQARVALVQAQANRYADTAALFVALGGGWWNRPDTDKAGADEVMNDKPRKAEDAR